MTLPEGELGDGAGAYAGRKLGESSATEKLHPAVHQHERERERHGSDGDRLGRAVIEGTPVRR